MKFFVPLALTTATLAVLAGCSPVVKPAPAPSSASSSATVHARNPYQGGAEEAWSAELADEPESVTYDSETKTLVVLSNHHSSRRLTGYTVTGKNAALPTWRYYLPPGATLTALDAGAGSVYLTIGPAEVGGKVAEKLDSDRRESRAARSDLVILSARTGTASFTWSTDSSLSGDIPQIVGAFGQSLGVVNIGRSSSVVAMLGANGAVQNQQRTYFPPRRTSEPQVSPGLVRLQTNKNGNGEYIQFPSLAYAQGNACWTATDGVVCLAAEGTLSSDARQTTLGGQQSSTPKAEQSANAMNHHTDGSGGSGIVVVEWNSNGHAVSITPASSSSAAFSYALAGVNADVSSRELRQALLENVEATTQGEPALLHDGHWISQSQWKISGEPVALGAPFVQAGANIVDVTSAKTVNKPGTQGFIGAGSTHTMFFQWDGKKLTYLRPLG
ncbi:hypothetical protein [Arcanobacterium canis]